MLLVSGRFIKPDPIKGIGVIFIWPAVNAINPKNENKTNMIFSLVCLIQNLSDN